MTEEKLEKANRLLRELQKVKEQADSLAPDNVYGYEAGIIHPSSQRGEALSNIPGVREAVLSAIAAQMAKLQAEFDAL